MKMFGFCLYATSLLCFGIGVTFAVEIHPPSQKVVENGPAIFTCVTSEPGSQISWFQSGRQLDEEKDEVTIKRINDFMSVLRIENAQIKKHKKKYTCSVLSGKLDRTEADATLKVLSKQRLHKYFPHILPIRSGDDVMLPSRDPGTIHMKCESLVTAKKSKPSWRWIKDDFIDLSLDHDDELEERIELTNDGDLIISKATVSDSGTYMCVAENNRGSAYGTPFNVNVQEGPPIPKLDGCVDDRGTRSKFGETYNVNGDPCTTCTCIEGVGLHCDAVSCVPRPCPPGQRIQFSSEICCETTCVPDIAHETDESNDDSESTKVCMDRDGIPVASGEIYMPDEDPCLQCECFNGRQGKCMMVACQTPTCEHYLSSRDICCNFTCLPTPPRITESCKDYKGQAVAHGDIYQPGSDPCETCECVDGHKGMCTQVVCDEPPCPIFRLIPGTCCGFECSDDEIDSVEIDLTNGHDDNYPNGDPCRTCLCTDGSSPLCTSVACQPPPMDCPHGVNRVPGMCCQFECAAPPQPLPNTLENADKVVGRIFIQQVGSSNAFVQWKTPEKYANMQSDVTVYYSYNSDMKDAHAVQVGSLPYAILRDLDPNTVYHVMANATLGNGMALMTSRPVRFSLDSRGRSAFVLSDALGQVFESRGSIAYDGYSLPRRFDPVVRTEDVKIVLNMESFHRVEVSRYNEEPCMDQDCGLLRFYLYNIDGKSINVMSLMFSSEQDFSWAKAHL